MNKPLHKAIFNKKRRCMMKATHNTTRESKRIADTAIDVVNGSSKQANFIHSSFSILSFSISLALSVATIIATPSVLANGIVVDKNAPKHQQATLLKTANGTPKVNIQTPTQAGVSINQYQQFDIEQRGVILNNSHRHTQTQLAGWIQANPWLAAAEAKVIVNQVNSVNPSMLKGSIEVAGKRAEVIIANPAGIQVNGGNFINTKGVVLSTAKPKIEQGQLRGYDAAQANIQIQGSGLNAQNSDYTQLISQQINIDAPNLDQSS